MFVLLVLFVLFRGGGTVQSRLHNTQSKTQRNTRVPCRATGGLRTIVCLFVGRGSTI